MYTAVMPGAEHSNKVYWSRQEHGAGMVVLSKVIHVSSVKNVGESTRVTNVPLPSFSQEDPGISSAHLQRFVELR